MKKAFVCPKCKGWEYETDEIRTTGAGFSRYFNVQNRRFTVVSCKRCGFAEFYKSGRTGSGSNILDFLTN